MDIKLMDGVLYGLNAETTDDIRLLRNEAVKENVEKYVAVHKNKRYALVENEVKQIGETEFGFNEQYTEPVEKEESVLSDGTLEKEEVEVVAEEKPVEKELELDKKVEENTTTEDEQSDDTDKNTVCQNKEYNMLKIEFDKLKEENHTLLDEIAKLNSQIDTLTIEVEARVVPSVCESATITLEDCVKFLQDNNLKSISI